MKLTSVLFLVGGIIAVTIAANVPNEQEKTKTQKFQKQGKGDAQQPAKQIESRAKKNEPNKRSKLNEAQVDKMPLAESGQKPKIGCGGNKSKKTDVEEAPLTRNAESAKPQKQKQATEAEDLEGPFGGLPNDFSKSDFPSVAVGGENRPKPPSCKGPSKSEDTLQVKRGQGRNADGKQQTKDGKASKIKQEKKSRKGAQEKVNDSLNNGRKTGQ